MDVFEVVKTMLAVRDYTDQPIGDGALFRILEAGRMTASRKNLQPWHFVVVRDKGLLAQLADLAPSGDYIRQAGGPSRSFWKTTGRCQRPMGHERRRA